MRFLDTDTLRFAEIPDSEVDVEGNQYAILSHRWDADESEVSFADINGSKGFSHKKGYAKLRGFCDRAVELNCRYGWADTCCINKGDPNELTEAINSMYRWYQGSHTCIVYLGDVPAKPMMESEWFDRGWTLQELVGPEDAFFYDHLWNLIGTKKELLAQLSTKTGIPEAVLSHARSPASCSVAQRMSWAAHRKTKRVEDQAYSPLGLFNVNMPPIYGEREQAFLRLQRTIIQHSKDESIFAWAMNMDTDMKAYTGLYAPSPSAYADCSDYVKTQGSTGFSEINGELSIDLWTYPHSMETYYAVLNCSHEGSLRANIAILVGRLSTENEFVRVNKSFVGGKISVVPHQNEPFKRRQIRVAAVPAEAPLNRFYGFWLRTLEPPGHTDRQIRILSQSSHSEEDRICLAEKAWGTAGIVYLEPKSALVSKHSDSRLEWSKVHWIKLGFDAEFNPLLFLGNNEGWKPYMRDPSLRSKPEKAIFEQAITSGSGSEAHDELFNNRWIYSEGGVPNRLHGWPGGLSVLKIDREKGINGTLEALNLAISVHLVADHSPIVMSLETRSRSPRQIWAMDLSDAGGVDPERDYAKAEKEIRDDEVADIIACCFGCASDEADTMTARRRDAQIRRKVLDASDLKQFS